MVANNKVKSDYFLIQKEQQQPDKIQLSYRNEECILAKQAGLIGDRCGIKCLAYRF